MFLVWPAPASSKCVVGPTAHAQRPQRDETLSDPTRGYLDQLVPYSICKTLKKKVNTTSFIFWFTSSINDKSKVDDGERIYKAETVSIKKRTNPRPRPRELYVCRHVTTRVIEGACGARSIRCVFTATGRQVNEK